MLQFVTILEEILWFEESSGIGRLIENFEINLSLNYEEENCTIGIKIKQWSMINKFLINTLKK